MPADIRLLTGALLPGLGPRALRGLAARGLTDVFAHPFDHGDLIPAGAAARLASGEALRRAEEEAAAARRLGIALVDWDAPEYPPLLARSYDPPPILYVQGSLTPPAGEATPVALVGARGASTLGRALARAMARDLAAAGATVVSGLARGIDSAAHLGALEGGGRTLAVLGSSIDCLYPAENRELAARIARQGALVSEFPLATGPRPSHFPRRNRVIAGLSLGVVVVEAAEKSGALITARLALDEGREVMAVPGHPSFPGARGSNQLLRDGAALVRDAADVAAELGLELRAVAPHAPGMGLLGALPPDVPLALEEIAARSGLELPELLAQLSRLELEAHVKRLPGPLYLRISPERV